MKKSVLFLVTPLLVSLGACNSVGSLGEVQSSAYSLVSDGGATPGDGGRGGGHGERGGGGGGGGGGGCSGGDGGERGGHHGPPPAEALAACDGLTDGAACSFALDGGTLTGVCHTDPSGAHPLACGPDGPPPGHADGDGDGGHRGPPQEAIDACASAETGSACTFTHDGNSVTGTCQPGPSADSPSACRPDGAPTPPPSGG